MSSCSRRGQGVRFSYAPTGCDGVVIGKGFRGSAKLRSRLMRVTTLDELQEVLHSADPAEPFPPEAMRVPGGRTAGRQKVTLPEGFLEDRLTDDASPTYVDPGSGG
jgi:hypothetical protein